MNLKKNKIGIFSISILFLLIFLSVFAIAAFAEEGADGSYSLIINKEFLFDESIPEAVQDQAYDKQYTFKIQGTRIGKVNDVAVEIPVDMEITLPDENGEWQHELKSEGPFDVTVTEVTDNVTLEDTDDDGKSIYYNMSDSICDTTTTIKGPGPTEFALKSNAEIFVSRKGYVPPDMEGDDDNDNSGDVKTTAEDVGDRVVLRVTRRDYDNHSGTEDEPLDIPLEPASGIDLTYDDDLKHLAGIYSFEEIMAPTGYSLQIGSREESFDSGEKCDFYINGATGSLTLTANGTAGDGMTHRFFVERIKSSWDDKTPFDPRTIDILSNESYTLENLPKGEYTVTEQEGLSSGNFSIKTPQSILIENRAGLASGNCIQTGSSRKYGGWAVRENTDYVILKKIGPFRNANGNNLTSATKGTYRFYYGVSGEDGYIVRQDNLNAKRNIYATRTVYEDEIIRLYPGADRAFYVAITNLTNTAAQKLLVNWAEYDEQEVENTYSEYATVTVDHRGWLEISKANIFEGYTYNYSVQDKNGKTVKTATLNANHTSVKLEGITAGSYTVRETVAPAGFTMQIEADTLETTESAHSFNITVRGSRTLTITKPACLPDKDHGEARNYTFNVTGPNFSKIVKIFAGSSSSEITLPTAGEYTVQALDDTWQEFDLKYSDSSSVYGNVKGTSTITFTNIFDLGSGAYRYVHEYYLKDGDNDYIYEGSSNITTVYGRPDHEQYTVTDIKQEPNFNPHNDEGKAYHYTHFSESYGTVDALPTSKDEEPNEDSDEALISIELSDEEDMDETFDEEEITDDSSENETPENPSDHETGDNSTDGETPETPSEGETDNNPSESETPENPSDGETNNNPSGNETPENPSENGSGNSSSGSDNGDNASNIAAQEYLLYDIVNKAQESTAYGLIQLNNEMPTVNRIKSVSFSKLTKNTFLDNEINTTSFDDKTKNTPSGSDTDGTSSDGEGSTSSSSNTDGNPSGDGNSSSGDNTGGNPSGDGNSSDGGNTNGNPSSDGSSSSDDTDGNPSDGDTDKNPSDDGDSSSDNNTDENPSDGEADEITNDDKTKEVLDSTTSTLKKAKTKTLTDNTDTLNRLTEPTGSYNGTAGAGYDSTHLLLNYVPDSGKQSIDVTDDASEIIILRYYRERTPEQTGGYKVIHEYYLRGNGTSDKLEHISEIKEVDGDLGTKYWAGKTAESELVPECKLTVDGVETTFHYTHDGRPNYGIWTEGSNGDGNGSLVPGITNNGDTYTPVDDWTTVTATKDKNQIIILRYYREVAPTITDPPKGSYNIVHEYYLRTPSEDTDENGDQQDTSGSDGDAGGDLSGSELETEEGDDNNSSEGTLTSKDGYIYTFEGKRDIENVKVILDDTKYYGLRSDWKLTNPDDPYQSYKYNYDSVVYGTLVSDNTDKYEYNPYQEWASSTEEGNEVIILRYYREVNTEKPNDPPREPDTTPGNPPGEPEDPEPSQTPVATPSASPSASPTATPENPGYPTELPDPNNPDSPDTITVWEDGEPRTYIKKWNGEEWVWILDEDVALSNAPDTGDGSNLSLWVFLTATSMICMGAFGFITIRKKKKTKS